MAVDADEFDLIVNAWAHEQADRRRPALARSRAADSVVDDDAFDRDGDGDGDISVGADLVGVAVDGKAVRGARRPDGTQVQLLAALRHDTGMVIGQRNVDNDKTNEILAFAPLLEPLNLAGTVVTADAMHTQRKAARLVVAKRGHYIFGVKENQPRLWSGTRRSRRGRPREARARELHPWSRPHRPPPGVDRTGSLFDRFPPREDLHHHRTRVVDPRRCSNQHRDPLLRDRPCCT